MITHSLALQNRRLPHNLIGIMYRFLKHSIAWFLVQSMKLQGKTQSAELSSDSQAKAIEDELLQDPPKGNLDKMRVLRSRLKRLSSKVPDRVLGSSTGVMQTPAGGPEGPDQQPVGSSSLSCRAVFPFTLQLRTV